MNCQVVTGLKMLLFQGAFQFKLFTGYEAPIKVMERSLVQTLVKGEEKE